MSRKHQNERHFFTEEKDEILLNIMNISKHRRCKEVEACIPERLPR
jgi:hypothetical protein